MASIQKTANGRYRARYRDTSGKEHLKRFKLKREAQRWLKAETAKIQTGNWGRTAGRQDHRAAMVRRPGFATTATTEAVNRPAGRGARETGSWRRSVRSSPGHRSGSRRSRPGRCASRTRAMRSRYIARPACTDMAQIYTDAIARSPRRPVLQPSRRTSPPAGQATPYVALLNRYGHSMTLWSLGTGPVCCWRRSPACDLLRSAA